MLKLRHFMMAVLASTAIQVSYAADCCPQPCDPCCRNPCSDFSAYVDYLLWEPRNCQLHYAATDDNPSNPLAERGRIYGVNPHLRSAFRLGVAKDCNEWDYGVRYTYFSSDYTNNVTDEDGYLASTRLNSVFRQTTDGAIQYAMGNYDVDLNQIDLELGYDRDYDCETEMRFYGGFRIAELDEKLTATYYSDLDDAGSNTPDSAADRNFNRASLHAYGFYLGSKVERTFCRCFYFYGDLSIGALVGKSNREWQQLQSAGGGNAFGEDGDYKLQNKCNRLVGNLDLALGIGYRFANCWYLSFGYEYNQWWNVDNSFLMGDFNSLQAKTSSDSFSLDGYVVRLGADF